MNSVGRQKNFCCFPEYLFELIPHDLDVVVVDEDGIASAFMSGQGRVEIVRAEHSLFGVTVAIGDQCHECRRDAPDILVPPVEYPDQLP